MPGCPSVVHITRFSLRKRECRSQCSHYYACLVRNNWIRTTEFSSVLTHSKVVYKLSCFRMHCHIFCLSDWYLFFDLLLKQEIELIQNHKNLQVFNRSLALWVMSQDLKAIGTFALFCYSTTLSLFRTILTHTKYF
jgi:hypothetical protein